MALEMRTLSEQAELKFWINGKEAVTGKLQHTVPEENRLYPRHPVWVEPTTLEDDIV